MAIITFANRDDAIGWLLDDGTAAEAHNMAALAYELAGIDPDEDEDGFDEFKYDVLEAELISNIEGAIDKAVDAMWKAVREGKYDPRSEEA